MRHKNESLFYEIKEYIEDCYERERKTPTTEEIATRFNMSASNTFGYLKDMQNRGIILSYSKDGITTDKISKMTEGKISVALVGSIACGTPTFAEENIEEYFSLPESLVGRGKFFLLRASGRSMIDAGINDGDLVLIRQQNTANPGQIIVALIDDEEATLKRYYPEPENERIRLHPENKRMKDFYVDNLQIQGVAVKVLKDLE